MGYGDQWKDTPENRERMRHDAETLALAQGIIYCVIRDKSSGGLGMQPKSMFDPEREELLFECFGGGQKAADARWEEKWRQLREQGLLPDEEGDSHIDG